MPMDDIDVTDSSLPVGIGDLERDVFDQAVLQTMDAVRDAVMMFDPETLSFIYVNQGAVDQLGYLRVELMEMSPVHLCPEFTEVSFRDTLTPLLAEEVASLEFSTFHRSKDGRDLPVEIVLQYPEAPGLKQPRVIVAVARDITERVTASTATSNMASAINSVSDAVFVCAEGTLQFLSANQGAIDLHGYSEAELLSGMTPLDLAPGLKTADVAAAIRGLVNDPTGSARLRTEAHHKSGAVVPVEVSINWPAPALKDGPRPVVAVVRDIADQVAAEVLAEALSAIRLTMLQGASRADGLRLLCKSARQVLDASAAMILTPTGDGAMLQLEASTGISEQARTEMSFTTDTGVVGEVFRSGSAIHVATAVQPVTPDSNRKVFATYQVGPVIIAPLLLADQIVGVLVVARLTGDREFDQPDHEPITKFAAGAVTAIELAQSRESEQTIANLEEKERLARNMHDTVIGRLFGTGMSLQSLAFGTDDPVTRERLGVAVEEIDTAVKEIRDAIFGLRSHPGWGKGAHGQILQTSAEYRNVLGFEPALNLEGPIDDVDEHIINELLPTLREALTNAGKYADASAVTVSVTVTKGEVRLEVEDDGSGFTPESEEGRADDSRVDDSHFDGHGLQNMRNRALVLNGTTSIRTSPGNGCTIKWIVPR